ncbi:PsbP-related protein [Leptothoe sp. EHU-05/26/07-4]
MDFDTKQTVRQFVLSIGALGIVLAPGSTEVAAEMFANHQEVEFAAGNAVNVKQEPSAPSEFARYESAKFSVDYPREWQIASQEDNGVEIVSIADGVNMPIRTDIVMLREDPQTAVPQKLDQIVADAVAVQRYSLVAIDGQSGFRIWYEPEAGQQALITFVGYGNEQTVVLSSQYSQVEDAEVLVTQIHDSFVNHSIARAAKPEQ